MTDLDKLIKRVEALDEAEHACKFFGRVGKSLRTEVKALDADRQRVQAEISRSASEFLKEKGYTAGGSKRKRQKK